MSAPEREPVLRWHYKAIDLASGKRVSGNIDGLHTMLEVVNHLHERGLYPLKIWLTAASYANIDTVLAGQTVIATLEHIKRQQVESGLDESGKLVHLDQVRERRERGQPK